MTRLPWIVLFAVVLVACGQAELVATQPAPTATTSAPEATPVPTAVAEIAEEPTTGPAASPTVADASTTVMAATQGPTSPPTQTEAAAPAVEDPGPPPPVTDQLHATDPSTVTLAAGRSQFVEVFAFW